MNPDIEYAVKQQLGNAENNLHRARAAFRDLATDDMNRQYGESGKTRSQIVAEYQADVDRWKKALASL